MLVLKCVPAPAPAIDTRPVVGAAAAEEEVVVKQGSWNVEAKSLNWVDTGLPMRSRMVGL